MKNCLTFLKKYKKQVILGPLFKLLEAIFELIIPLLMGRIIDIAIPNYDMKYILIMGGVIILLGILGLICSLTCQYYASYAANGYGRDLRKAMFKHINSLSHQELDQIGSANLINIMTNDIDQLETTINFYIRLLLRAPFIVVGSVVLAFFVNYKIGLIFLVATIVLSLIIFLIMRPAAKRYLAIQEQLDNISRLSNENLSGMRVVRAFNKQEEALKRYQNATKMHKNQTRQVISFTSFLNPLTYAIIQLAIIAILYISSIEINIGTLKQGEVISVVNYMNQILIAIVAVSNLVMRFTKAMASYKRCNRILNLTASIQGKEVINQEEKNRPFIEFKDVSFFYPNSENKALENLNFKINHGDTLGIIGGTGSGKSTIISLIERFYDASEGLIYIDGIDIRDINLDYYRSQIALVEQHASLFKGTIRSNLLMSNPNASEEDMKMALCAAEANFVFDYPSQLDHRVEEDGKNFSGGQKQRLTIARALLRNPSLLILDDSTSALDYLTDKKVRSNIAKNYPLCTIIIVSQRATSIKYATNILVIDTGEIVGQGSHEQLLNNCEIYQEIYESQIKKEDK